MPRPRWRPEAATDEQRQAIEGVADKARKANNADAELWEAVKAARDLKVPLSYLAEVAGRGRATLHRHVPAKKSTREPRPR